MTNGEEQPEEKPTEASVPPASADAVESGDAPPEVEEEAESTEPQTQTEPEREPEIAAEPVEEPEPQAEPVEEPAAETETPAEPEPQAEPVAEPEPQAEPVEEPAAETETPTEPEPQADVVEAAEPAVEPALFNEPEAEPVEQPNIVQDNSIATDDQVAAMLEDNPPPDMDEMEAMEPQPAGEFGEDLSDASDPQEEAPLAPPRLLDDAEVQAGSPIVFHADLAPQYSAQPPFPGEGWDWDGTASQHPAAVGDKLRLWHAANVRPYIAAAAENAVMRYWWRVPVRKGQVFRLSASMQNNLLTAGNEFKVYPVVMNLNAADLVPLVLTVTGTLTPDATGTYYRSGSYGISPAYVRTDGAYWIYIIAAVFVLSATKGATTGIRWQSTNPVPEDAYAPLGGAAGTATAEATAWLTFDSAVAIGHSALFRVGNLSPGVEDDEEFGVMAEATAIAGGGWGYGTTPYTYAADTWPLLTATVEYLPRARGPVLTHTATQTLTLTLTKTDTLSNTLTKTKTATVTGATTTQTDTDTLTKTLTKTNTNSNTTSATVTVTQEG